MTIASQGGVLPVLVLNKTDLVSTNELAKRLLEIRSRFPKVEVVTTSAKDKGGLDSLRSFMRPGKTYCFLGSSGVGKSSMINELIGEGLIKTGGISSYSDRGKHTTTARQMYFLKSGAIVIDNPGTREVGLAVKTVAEVDFGDIEKLAESCQYRDCSHTNEPGCAVMLAIRVGNLDEKKYQNFLTLKKEMEYREQSELDKREKERKFGRMIKNAKRGLRRLND
jgi:ribosome biogenesis GTPase